MQVGKKFVPEIEEKITDANGFMWRYFIAMWCKGVEVLARLKGLNAPEETVLKNGGVSDDYVPRGVDWKM